MPVECFDALTKFAVNRFVWHRRKCKQIKDDIDRRTYGPGKIVSDWLECWCTTVDDWGKAMKLAHNQVVTIVFQMHPSLQAAVQQSLPVLVTPGTTLDFTEVVFTRKPGPPPSPTARVLTRENFSAVCDSESVGFVVTVTPPPTAGALAEGTYQTLLYAEDLDGDPAPLAVVLVDVRATLKQAARQ